MMIRHAGEAPETLASTAGSTAAAARRVKCVDAPPGRSAHAGVQKCVAVHTGGQGKLFHPTNDFTD